jgi:hypothetical protein
MKTATETSLRRLLTNLKTKVDLKADTSHTHDRVNGVKLVVSTTAPTTTDNTIITFVKGAS